MTTHISLPSTLHAMAVPDSDYDYDGPATLTLYFGSAKIMEWKIENGERFIDDGSYSGAAYAQEEIDAWVASMLERVFVNAMGNIS